MTFIDHLIPKPQQLFKVVEGLPSDPNLFRCYPIDLNTLSVRSAHALAALGVHTWGDLEVVTETDLIKLGLGRKGVNLLKDTLLKHGTHLGARWQEPPLPARLYERVILGVYFIRCERFVKIGYAKNIRKRIADIACAVPFPLQVPAVISCATISDAQRVEREHHERFRELHYRGEWFRYEDELPLYVMSLQERVR